MKIIQAILVFLFCVHFIIIGMYHMPDNPIKHQFKYQINSYVHPFFSQEWKLFAPNPVSSNMSVVYRFKTYKDTVIVDQSHWLEVASPIVNERSHHFWSPGQRILKHLSTCYLDVIKTRAKAVELSQMVDTLQSDSAKQAEFVKDNVSNSAGNRGILSYAKYVLKKYDESRNEEIVNDSILVQYRIVDAVFPRFSDRKLDYNDEGNYEIRELLSDDYRIR